MGNSLKNISLAEFRKFLEYKGCRKIRTKGGHEIWSGEYLPRPIVLQSHIDPVPLFIIRNNLKTLGASVEELAIFLNR